jgi:hypothetical protein
MFVRSALWPRFSVLGGYRSVAFWIAMGASLGYGVLRGGWVRGLPTAIVSNSNINLIVATHGSFLLGVRLLQLH